MIVINTPSADLAHTNVAYCSSSDLENFRVPDANLFLASVAGHSLVLSLASHTSVNDGHIALNSIHRRQITVSTGDSVSLSRFIPPDNFNLALLTVDLQFVRRGAQNVQLDAVLLANHLRNRFINQVMTVGQGVAFEYQGNNYVFTASQAAVEGQETRSNAVERGMISSDTYFIFEAHDASGIKIVSS